MRSFWQRTCCVLGLLLVEQAASGSCYPYLPQVHYREYSRPTGALYMEMSPPRAELPGHAVVFDAKTGKPLWRTIAYSPAAQLSDDGEQVLLNLDPQPPGTASGSAWAVSFYRRGKNLSQYTVQELLPEAKSRQSGGPADRPLAWLANVAGFDTGGRSFRITLVNGTTLSFRAETGRLEQRAAGQPPSSNDWETGLAAGYREALRLRADAGALHSFAVKLLALGAADAPAANRVHSPYGWAGVFAALAEVVDEPTAARLNALFPAAEASPEPLLERYQRLERTLSAVAAAPGVPGARLPAGRIPVVRSNTVLWLGQGLSLEKPAAERLARLGQVEVKEIDFGESKVAASRINAVLPPPTTRPAKPLVTPEELGARTQLLITGSVGFAGRWAQPFDRARTDPRGKFVLPSGKSVVVPMMKGGGRFPYWSDDAGRLSAVELPYRGDRYSMVILLPERPEGLPKLEQQLATTGLARVLDALDGSLESLQLSLPRFTVQGVCVLESSSARLGLPQALALKRLGPAGTSNRPAILGSVRQRSWVAVDEQGTEADAVTSVSVSTIGVPPKTLTVEVAHPFLFFIRDRSTNAVLFLGRITDPASA